MRVQKQHRYNSEPPPRRSFSRSPDPQDNNKSFANRKIAKLHHDSPTSLGPPPPTDPQASSATALQFPPTPTSSADDRDRSDPLATSRPPQSRVQQSKKNHLLIPSTDIIMRDRPVINSASDTPPLSASSATNRSHTPTSGRHPEDYSLNSSSSPSPSTSRSMSIRVDSVANHQRSFHDVGRYPDTRPSPPPITTLSNSPSLSSDRSSGSSPAPTLPPIVSSNTNTHPYQQHQYQSSSSQHHRYSTQQQNSYHSHPSHYYPAGPSPDVYSHHSPQTPYTSSYQHSYSSPYVPQPPSYSHQAYAPPPAQPAAHMPPPMSHHTPSSFSQSGYPQQYVQPGDIITQPHGGPPGHGHGYGDGGVSNSIIYTSDAATKLSDRVRRRCFNCCTSDTSTWRRSSLNPGKVLCNKCGLFERTHARPRPDQFPHKRGLLSAPFPNRSPTHDSGSAGPAVQQQQQQHQQQSHVQHNQHSVQHNQHSQQQQHPQQQQSGQAQQVQVPNVPPPANHPSLAAAYTHPSALPQIQEWLRNPSTQASSPSSSQSQVSGIDGLGSSSNSNASIRNSPGVRRGSIVQHQHQHSQNATSSPIGGGIGREDSRHEYSHPHSHSPSPVSNSGSERLSRMHAASASSSPRLGSALTVSDEDRA